MKNIFIVTFLLICFATIAKDKNSAPSANNYKVIPVNELNNAVTNKLLYILPKTELVFTVNIEKTTQKRGPYYRYSERYLGLKDYITEDSEEMEIVGISLHSNPIPDKNHIYSIEVGDKMFPPCINKGPNGCIISINAESKKFIDLKHKHEPRKRIRKEKHSFDKVPLTEDILIASSSVKMAEETAALVGRIRENRILLLSGESTNAPGDGKALEVALSRLDALENQYLSLFKGITSKSQITEEIKIVPDKAINRNVLFRFSKFKGIVGSNDISGSPVTIEIDTVGQIQLPNALPEPEFTKKGELIAPKDIDRGIIYRNPAIAQITVMYNGKKILRKKIQLAQLGQVASLPNTIAISNNQGILFYPSGAIKSIINK